MQKLATFLLSCSLSWLVSCGRMQQNESPQTSLTVVGGSTASSSSQPAQPEPKLPGETGEVLCKHFYESSDALQGYIGALVSAPEESPNDRSERYLRDAANHFFLGALLRRDAAMLAELVPSKGTVTFRNTMESEVVTWQGSELVRQLKAKQGDAYKIILGGDGEDDLADRFNSRSDSPVCRNGTTYFFLEHPLIPTYISWSTGPSPRLVGFGIAGL